MTDLARKYKDALNENVDLEDRAEAAEAKVAEVKGHLAKLSIRCTNAEARVAELEGRVENLNHKRNLACKERDALMPAGRLLKERDEAEAKVARLRDDIKHLPTNRDLADTEQELERIEHRLHQATEALRELESASTWLVKCFHDMQDKYPVRGLPEAEAGFAAAVRSALATLEEKDEPPH